MAERLIRFVLRNRKNSGYYKTQIDADVSDVITSERLLYRKPEVPNYTSTRPTSRDLFRLGRLLASFQKTGIPTHRSAGKCSLAQHKILKIIGYKRMTLNYQLESSHIADYDLYTLPGVDFTLRGPQWPLHSSSQSISFLGAAQTFGAFCKYPFPNLLGEMLSARIFNYGRGGAGPGFYSNQKAVIENVNQTDCCIVQVMSARSSVKNSYMESVEGLTTVRMLKGAKNGHRLQGHIAYRKLGDELSRDDFFALIEETRKGFIEQCKVLAEQITVPKVLLYVGCDAPLKDLDFNSDWSTHNLVGLHPHMISERVMLEVSKYFDDTVLVYGRTGSDKHMVNRFTGDYVSIKRSESYTVKTHNCYISPYLHMNAALSLYEPINKILSKDGVF